MILSSKIHITSYFNPHFIEDEMRSFYDALRAYGFTQVTFEPYTVVPDAVNILFCGFNLGSDLQKTLLLEHPLEQIIVRNLEPVFPTGTCMFPSYIQLMKKYPVWDYAEGNLVRLKQAGIDHAEYLPPIYMPHLERIPCTIEQDIDVCFYGYLSPRRQHVVDQLVAKGLKVHVNTFNDSKSNTELDEVIARSKVMLNMGNYDQFHIFEIVRAALPLANHKVVVTELNAYSEIDPAIKAAVLHCPYDQLVDFCVSVVNDPALRRKYAEQSYQIFKQQDGTALIGAAMRRYFETQHSVNPPAPTATLPQKMKLRCKKNWSLDYLNLDIEAKVRSDLHLDIGREVIDCTVDYESWRFGKFKFKMNYFEEIVADQVLQSVDDLYVALKNCLYLLAENGNVRVSVPYYLSPDAWQHPLTKRAFTEQSFEFLKDLYVNVATQRFQLEVSNLTYILSAHGMALYHEQHVDIAELLRIPTAIKSLSVILTKKPVVLDDNVGVRLGQSYEYNIFYDE